MVKMKTDRCPSCGGMVFKLAGKASKLCHDRCLDCRRADEALAERRQNEDSEMAQHLEKHPHG